MPPKLLDPIEALKEDRKATEALSAAQVAKAAPRPALVASTHLTPANPESPLTLLERCKADFRVFLTLVWRQLLGVDPSPIQLDMAYWLQHGPDRAIIMAFRGFSKSWITGAYALWRLLVDPNEKILVVSGSMKRATATTNWCLQLIMQMDILKDLRPRPSDRQSSIMFDVGNCVPAQSASFMAAGIGGQLVGFRGTCIIPDDVETQTNSLTVVMREKVREAVKEFESVLTPDGVIKYLGTPHDSDSLYTYLLALRDVHGRSVYQARIWPALFPTQEQVKGYGAYLAPYITGYVRKHGPSVVGHSTMPNRFPDENLETRRAAIGNSEFALQFMLDLSASFTDKYPLKLRDLIVTDLDPRQGPEEVVWGNTEPHRDLPVMGFDGDYYFKPAATGEHFSRYQKVIGFVDPSGHGSDETALVIVALHFGRVYWLHLWATRDGFTPATLRQIAKDCVRFGVHTLYHETNYGGGMFGALLLPVLVEEWRKAEKLHKGRRDDQPFGTALEEVTAGKTQNKERRILSVVEPVVQQHRLVVNKAVIEWDQKSIQLMAGEETRHRYAWGYQYTHITKEKDCLGREDRLDALAGALAQLAEDLGVNPEGMGAQSREDRYMAAIMKLIEDDDELAGYGRAVRDNRVESAKKQVR